MKSFWMWLRNHGKIKKNPDVVKIKLEVLEKQNELIKEEFEEREAKKKKKEGEEEELELSESDDKKAKQMHDGDATTIPEVAEQHLDEASKKTEAAEKAAVPEGQNQTTEYDVENEEDEEKELSAEEIEAIAQLLSPNAVLSEREELERIKSAMISDDMEMMNSFADLSDSPSTSKESSTTTTSSSTTPTTPTRDKNKTTSSQDTLDFSEEMDDTAVKVITEMDDAAAKEVEASTIIDMEPPSTTLSEEEVQLEEEDDTTTADSKLDKSIARLQSKVDDMVGKIEIQLSDVEAKIGNKMHLLDKDNDGILTNAEIAEVLQQVLKRDLTFEEAMAIASDMDENEDGVMSVAEMIKWTETNKLVKLAEEGRDADLDAAIAKKAMKLKEKKKSASEEEAV